MSRANEYIDVSSNNALVDVAAYADAGYKHLCRKVSEGTGYHWIEGDALADRAHRHGLHVGHYHWLREDEDPFLQARRFVSLVKPHLGKPPTPGAWPPDGDWLMTDLESTAGEAFPGDSTRARQLHAFNTEMQSQLREYPLFTYTGNWYLDGRPLLQAEARKWLIVMSDYSGVDHLPNPYGLTYVAWQDSDRATVPGQPGLVDHNHWLPEPTKHFAGDPTLTERLMLKIARTVAVNLARAILLGGDHGYFTHKRFPNLVRNANHGLLDRVARLEEQAK